MAETSLVVRHGDGNRNCSPTFLFGVWGSSEDTTCTIWTPHVGEKAATVREPGNKYDRFAVAALEDEMLCTIGHFFLVVQDFALLDSFVVQC